MARIIKRVFTKPLPSGAELIDRMDRASEESYKLVRFRDAKGRRIEGRLSRNGGKVVFDARRHTVAFALEENGVPVRTTRPGVRGAARE